MDAELFIHGPRHAFYGKKEDSKYCQLFDNSQIKDEIRFIVEIREGDNGRLYAYYTYCRYANVLDIDGRSGAYIGLTIRLDAYYANLRNLFTVLEATFYAKVVGLLVKKSGDIFQYLVSDFKNSQQSILNNVEKSLGNMLAGIVTSSDVFPIDSSFSTEGREVIKGLDDNQYSAARMADIKKYGRLAFSSSVEIDKISKLYKEFDGRQQTLKDDFRKEVTQIQREFDDASSKNISFQEDIRQKNGQIETLQNEIKQLKQNIESKDKEYCDHIDGINQLKEQIATLEKERYDLREIVNQIRCEFDDASSKNISFQEDIRQKNGQIETLQNEIKQLKQNIKSKDKEHCEQIAKLNKGRDDLASQLIASDSVKKSLSSNKQRSEEKHRHLKKTPNLEHHNESASTLPDDDDHRGHQDANTQDEVPCRRNIRELGEGLLKVVIPFLLFASGALFYAFFLDNKDNQDNIRFAEKTQPVQMEVVRSQKVTIIPNKLTNRLFLDCDKGNTAEKLNIDNADIPIHISLLLDGHDINVDEFEWLIKDIKGSICLQDTTRERNIDFLPDSLGAYTVQVFVNDTLIVMKRFEF